MVGRTIGRYRVMAKIGRGGYATVWRAHDPLLDRNVALKLLNDELAASPIARQRFHNEARSAAALDHPGIVTVYDSGQSEGFEYMTLSLIDGETLSDRAARRLLPFDEAVRIVVDAAEALEHAHRRDVIHRDVTGRNIMIARDGRVVVLDFGLALASWESRLTSTQTTMGTAPYMAPEVMRGEKANVRSDVYGLGTVLYEALTGTLPFPGGQAQTWFYLVMNTDPVPPHRYRPDLPPALEEVVLKAIARDPERRFQTADAFRDALQAFLSKAKPDDFGRTVEPRANGAGASPSVAVPVSGRDVPAGAPTYLAVLPFAAISGSADPEEACSTLASRLAETIAGSLSRAPGLRVVPPLPAPESDDPRRVAQYLGANLLLSGSVRRTGSQVRVEFSIRDPWRGLQLAGSVIDGSALQVFDVEDRVVASIARELGVDATGAPAPARPADPAAHERYLQALGYLRRYDNEASVDGAIHLLERLIASEGSLAIYHAALARAFLLKYERTKQRVWENRAAAECQRAHERDADAVEVRVAMGAVRLRTGQHASAREEFERALHIEPGSLDAMLGLVRAEMAMGKLDEAEQTCRRAIDSHPDDWRGHILLGRILFDRREFSRALGSMRRVNELTPDNALGRRHLGTTLYRLDRFEEAAAAYRESLAIQPNDEAYGNLGAALYFLGRDEEALAVLRKATELTPGEPRRWGYLGSACCWIPGHESEARAPLERAVSLMRERLEINPTQAESWALLAAWLANLGRLDEARAAIEEAVRLGPDVLECMVQAGHVYHQLGDRKTCLLWLRAARRAGYGAGELRRSRELQPLREDPEFMALLTETPARAGEQS